MKEKKTACFQSIANLKKIPEYFFFQNRLLYIQSGVQELYKVTYLLRCMLFSSVYKFLQPL